MNAVVISQKRIFHSRKRQISKERDSGLPPREADDAAQRVLRRLGIAARVKKAKIGMELVWIKELGRKEVEIN